MSSQALSRLAGIALLLGGALSVAGTLIGFLPGDPTTAAYFNSVPYFLNGMFVFVGAALVVLGLPAVIAAQATRAGALTTIGVACLILVNLIYNISNTFVDLTIFPYLATNPATHDFAQSAPPVMAVFFYAGMLLAVIGALTLGIAILRAGVFPRWIGVLLLLVVPAQILASFDIPIVESIAPLLGALALIGLGSTLMSARRVTAAQPAAVAA